MELVVHQILAGLATGSIYALMALAIVMIYRATGHLNFAQGEMATMSTFVAWQLLQWRAPYWIAFTAAVILSFFAGIAIERLLFRPLHRATVFAHIAASIALFSILNSATGFIWDASIKTFPTPFGAHPVVGGLISTHEIGMIAVAFVLIFGLHVFFNHTRPGLGMRATVANPLAAQMFGIGTGWLIAVGWGMAAAIGAVSGMLIAPVVFLEPNMMVGILVYGFAGAVLGGLARPARAAAGGFAVGVIENLAGTFIPYGRDMKLSIALMLIVIALIASRRRSFESRVAAGV
ncbi:MAG TPA: branched-chain amino acid ABC transporter permease [Pseudorhodoplanes sp.]|jgi:branched-chain amino acid transport system permease protein|nr:branched-chain amino acid ABC transporter permease [Pseudorhodoplanes sp.]